MENVISIYKKEKDQKKQEEIRDRKMAFVMFAFSLALIAVMVWALPQG